MKNLICELISAVTKYFKNATELQERDLQHKEKTDTPRIGLATEVAPKKRRPYVRGRHVKRVRRSVCVEASAEAPVEATTESTVKVAVGRRYTKRAASGVARKTRKTHGATPDTVIVAGEKLVSRRAFCKLVGLRYSTVRHTAGSRAFPQGQMVRTPYHRPYAYLADKWVALATGCKNLGDFERSCRWHRGPDKKAKRIYISEVLKWTGLPAELSSRPTPLRYGLEFSAPFRMACWYRIR